MFSRRSFLGSLSSLGSLLLCRILRIKDKKRWKVQNIEYDCISGLSTNSINNIQNMPDEMRPNVMPTAKILIYYDMGKQIILSDEKDTVKNIPGYITESISVKPQGNNLYVFLHFSSLFGRKLETNEELYREDIEDLYHRIKSQNVVDLEIWTEAYDETS